MSEFVLKEDQQTTIMALRTELAALKSRQATCQQELNTLEAELGQFERLYNDTVGIRLVVLDELEAKIAEFAAARHPKDAAISQRATETRARAMASARSLGRAPEAALGENEQPQATSQSAEFPRFMQFETDPKSEQPNKTSDDSPLPTLKSIWRQVAMYFHPDRVRDENDKDILTELMVEANIAYESGDRGCLDVLLIEGQLLEAAEPGALQFLHLTMMVRRVGRQVEELEAQIAVVLARDVVKLKQRVDDASKTGTDLLARMSGQVDEQIIAAELRVASMAKKVAEDDV